ncbi:MAG: terpene cyclase/mutase family protein [Anaplasmataceae bacterium]|nr:terpene cyclase/mutase family protein [Anaplasmataceae bacterium]
MKRYVLIILCILAFISIYYSQTLESLENKIRSVKDKALSTLASHQLASGEFPMEVCGERLGNSWCKNDSTPVFTAYVLYALNVLKDDPQVKDLAAKSVRFLKSESVDGLIWRSTTSQSGAQNLRPDIVDQSNGNVLPDFDTTSLVSLALEMFDQAPANQEVFNKHRNQDGLLYLWHKQTSGEQNQEIDCGTVANSLTYLKNNDVTSCQYLYSFLDSGNSCSLYYDNGIILDYLTVRAWEKNQNCFDNDFKNLILQRIISRKKTNNSYGNDMETALSISTLLRLGYETQKVEKSIEWLISQQGSEGLWQRQELYHFSAPHETYYTYGAKELTTAFALEALALYEKAL